MNGICFPYLPVAGHYGVLPRVGEVGEIRFTGYFRVQLRVRYQGEPRVEVPEIGAEEHFYIDRAGDCIDRWIFRSHGLMVRSPQVEITHIALRAVGDQQSVLIHRMFFLASCPGQCRRQGEIL